MPRLTVFLGGGGVGKTTLSAAYALALARSGRRVALVSIDPARRLQSALGVSALPEEGVAVVGGLRAAMLHPADSLRRWVAESCPDENVRARLFANPFFTALADRIAAATDAIAAVRVAEWAEREPDLDEIVVDTAPGVAALEFLTRPDKIMEFLDGRLIGWLRRFDPSKRIFRGLSRISGAETLRQLGEFFALVDDALRRMTLRLERARAWLREPATRLIVVAAVHDDAARVAHSLADSLRAVQLEPRLAVLNRALPTDAAIDPSTASGPARAFLYYVARQLRTQARVRAELDFARVIEIPEATLDGERLEALARLGAALLDQG